MWFRRKHASLGQEPTQVPEAVADRAARKAYPPIVPYKINEDLANKLALRAYGDADHDGRPDIPRMPLSG